MDEDEARAELWREEADKLMEREPLLEEIGRKLGLYDPHSQVITVETPMGPKPALVAHFTVGEIAWRPRTQDPESEAFDRQFREMEASMVGDEFLDARQRMAANIAAGRDPLDDGDDGEDDEDPEDHG